MTWRIDLPIIKPLSLNGRMHWRAHYVGVAQFRDTTRLLARQGRIPAMNRCQVVLHYSPKDHRRRDAENLVPTSKACVDGLVLAGVIPDDCEPYFTPTMPVLDEPNGKVGRLWLIVSRVACVRCGGEGMVDGDVGMVTCGRCGGSGNE